MQESIAFMVVEKKGLTSELDKSFLLPRCFFHSNPPCTQSNDSDAGGSVIHKTS